LISCFAWRRGLPMIALGSGLGAWLWVSRDEEVLALIAAVALCEVLGRLIAGRRNGAGTAHPRAFTSSPWLVAVVVAVLFSLSFLARVGLQRGLDFTSMDFGAGSFGDPQASGLRITVCLVWKYVSAELLLLMVLLQRATADDRRTILLSFSAVAGVRAVTICLMLFVCRTSYWTAFRALSDAGPALCCLLAGALLLGAWEGSRSAAGDVRAEEAST
jgi:hypothetical protein